jgi:hypothetical protein
MVHKPGASRSHAHSRSCYQLQNNAPTVVDAAACELSSRHRRVAQCSSIRYACVIPSRRTLSKSGTLRPGDPIQSYCRKGLGTARHTTAAFTTAGNWSRQSTHARYLDHASIHILRQHSMLRSPIIIYNNDNMQIHTNMVLRTHMVLISPLPFLPGSRQRNMSEQCVICNMHHSKPLFCRTMKNV